MSEPQIHSAIRFGTALENVLFDPATRSVDFDCSDITENTRACYPLEYVANARMPAVGGHPSNIVFLTADAFGGLLDDAPVRPDGRFRLDAVTRCPEVPDRTLDPRAAWPDPALYDEKADQPAIDLRRTTRRTQARAAFLSSTDGVLLQSMPALMVW
jgi:ATP-dependent phosphoenolpyruvate carboxykinase